MQDEQERRGKVRTVFMLDPGEREALNQLSAATGAPIAELIRRSVAHWLARENAPRNVGVPTDRPSGITLTGLEDRGWPRE